MNDAERKHMRELLEISRKRLRWREQQAGVYGINVPRCEDVPWLLPPPILPRSNAVLFLCYTRISYDKLS